MPKRISKKLLVGLGSIIAFGTIGTVSGFGVKSIIDSTWNNRDINQLNSSNPVTSFNNIPDFNVATSDMFIKTKNLTRFHFGNTQIGQKVTPWGWLGVFDDKEKGVKSRIALTGWNGEIIWVNEDYPNLDKMDVYDMQYDFGSNLIFVLRTKANNGFYNSNEDYPEVYLEVLDAKTGKKYKDDVEYNDFKYLQLDAKKKLIQETTLLDGYETDSTIREKTKHLYYLDLTYSSQKNAILATWMPNYMQMARQKYKGNQEGSLPSFFDVINTWDKVATSFMFDTEKLINNQTYDDKKRNFQLVKSSGITKTEDTQGKPKFWIKQGLLDNNTIDAENIFLLTNPFFTTSHDGNAFVMHLIGSTVLGDVYHKTIGWKIDTSDSPKKGGEIYEYKGGSTTLDKKKYDNIQILTKTQGFFDLKDDKSWTMAKGWNPYFINANLRVNKNMFDENSIVFAYPYSSSSDVEDQTGEKYGNKGYGMPVFNVAQIWLNKDGSFIKTKENKQKDHINYNFGKQIDDYYVKNNYGKNYTDKNLNNIYPYPSPGSFDENNVNHTYNRLISVSPFDNTIIYAAKPNVREDIFGPHNQNQKYKWAGFWIGNRWGNPKNEKLYHPLIIGNDQSIVSTADDRFNQTEMNQMLDNINDLYRDGFTFDVSSAYEPDTFRLSLNLYFNQTGTGINSSYENKDEDFKTSKIGVIRDVLYDSGSHQESQSGDKGWGRDVVTKFPGIWNNASKKLFATTINKDSFASLIHSRANLEKWYPRTWANLNFPSNMLKVNEIFWINRQERSDIAVASQFGKKLTGSIFNTNKSIDLVSSWKDNGENSTKYNNRFSRLIMKRPTIKADSKAEENNLNLVVNYSIDDGIKNKIINKKGWEINEKDQQNLILTQNVKVMNTSVQILSAWGDSYKMKKIAETTGSIDSTNTYWNEEITVTAFLDKKDKPNLAFGNGNNNNMSRNNGAKALRLMLKLVKPTGSLPGWFTTVINDSTFFNKAYPVEAAFDGETTFKDIINQFSNLKAQNLDLSDDKNNGTAVSLANLKIEASLELNPKFGGYDAKDKFYNGPSGSKILVDKNNNQKIIYIDNVRIDKTIYDESLISYTDIGNNNAFSSSLSTSAWSSKHEINSRKHIKVTTDYSLLPDNLVRQNVGDKSPVFSFDYQVGASNKLEITPNNPTWFLNHFKNYNRMIGLFAQFQYQTTNNNDWVDLGSPLSDQEIVGKLQNGKLILDTSVTNIKKLRFKLVKDRNANSEFPIEFQNFNEGDRKYISNEHTISSQRYIVKANQIQSKFFANVNNETDKLLNTITKKDIEDYVKGVVNDSISDADIKEKVTLKFEYDGATDLTVEQLWQKLQTKINGNTPFAISPDGDENKGSIIKAYFSAINSNDGIIFIRENDGSVINGQDTKESVKSNLVTKIDVSSYITQITTTGLTVNPPATIPGTFNNDGNDIQFPTNNASSGFLSRMTFSEMKNALQAVGVTIRFKGYDLVTQAFGNWQTNLTAIKNYNPLKPEIKIGFQVDSNWKVKMFNGTEITDNTEIPIKLNLPKLIIINPDLVNTFKTDHGIGGNTKNLTSDQSKITKLIQDIKQDAQNQQIQGIDQAPLEVVFKLGNTTREFVKINELIQTLSSRNADVESNKIDFKIQVTKGKETEWILSNNQTYELLDDQNTTVPIFVHDAGIWNDIDQGTTISGTNTNLTWKFPINDGFTINSDDTFADSSSKGKGLKLEFTTDKNLDIDQNGWESRINSVGLGVDAILLRIVAKSNSYIYQKTAEKNNTKIQINLDQIQEQINVDSSWLKQNLVDTETDINQAITTTNLQKYEKSVMDSIPNLDDKTKKKLTIKYSLGDQNNFVDKSEFVKLVQQYANSTTFDILQLWNDTGGVKITAKFFKANPNGLYDLIYQPGAPQEQQLETKQITTTIEFDKVIKWLTETPKLVEVSGTETVAKFKIPNLQVNDDAKFNNKSWEEIINFFKEFGITIQYRPKLTSNTSNNNGWVDDLSKLNQYDSNIGKIQIRFKFDKRKSINIKLKTADNKTYSGKDDNETDSFDLSLAIKLTLNVDQTIVNNFIQKPNVISGNTKYLTINKADQEEMINEIKKQNSATNNEFNKANLIVKYKLESQPDSKWNQLDQFVEDLKNDNSDQTSNKVLFKFEVLNDSDFAVDNSTRVLFDPTKETDRNQWKVKIFVNDSTWENDAKTVTVTGKTSGLTWNWNSLNGKVNDDPNTNKVGTDKIQVEFSAKTGADYDDADAADTAIDLTTGWTTIKPKVLDPKIQNLYIRIKAKSGYVYGPGYNENSHPKTAKAHQVNLQIKREILVDPTRLSTSLTLEQNANFLNDITSLTFENFVQAGLNHLQQQDLKDRVTVKFNFKGEEGLSSQEIYQRIKSIISSNNDPDYGVLQLWNGQVGEKIDAYYTLKDPNDNDYELITVDNKNPEQPQELVTGHIKTKINLKDIVDDLKAKKIEVISTSKVRNIITIKDWKMPKTKIGLNSLHNLDWKIFEQRLKEVGVVVEAKMVTNTNNNNDWKPLNDLKTYDDTTLKLALRFKIESDGSNVVLSLDNGNDTEYDPNGDSATSEFQMNIKAPAMVVVNSKFLDEFKKNYQIGGNTKKIQLDKNTENTLINKIVEENMKTNPDIFNGLESRLIVEYYLGKDGATATDDQWKNQVDFIEALQTTNVDQITNEIWFRLNVKDSTGPDGQIFQINKKSDILNHEDISDKAKVKIFINETGFTDKINTLKAVGSTDSFEIEGLDEWKKLLPRAGLKVQWSKETTPTENDDTNWSDQQPTTLNPDKKLWLRFKVEDGYEFESARTDNPKYSDKKEINTDEIKVIIKLQKTWLENIKITGNFNEPNINEDKVMQQIQDAAILPQGKPDLVHLEYRIRGNNDWFDKDAFIKKLKELKGSKDDKNFILKREELEVRFAIKENENNQYGLEIDSTVITDANRNDFNVQIIDSNRNDAFIGIINLEWIKDFTEANFRVQGSTSKPELIITNKQAMDTLFMPYQTDPLFDVIYSTDYNETTKQWNWTQPKNSILKNGQFIEPADLWQQLQATIGPNKKFAIKFLSKKDKYKVYKDNTKYDDGYILDLSNNVKITIEINNPFTTAGKTLGIWTREDNKEAHYYQGQGGFKIVLADINTLKVDPDNIESAEQFLQNSALAPNEKAALELVFHNFGPSASQDEIERVKKAITSYDDTWKTFDSIKEKASGEWSKDLGLKVGDYVAVALRVKKEHAIKDDPFVLKNDDYSMILPVMPDSTGTEKDPGRISGYKIKSDEIQIQNGSLILTNVFSSQLPPLDGWTELQQLNLVKDELGNYLGVNLSLQLYTEFHKDKKGNILLSGSGANLVKRESTGPNIESAGFYKDASGQNIKDDKDQDIAIYKDKNTQRLSAPIKSTKRNKSFIHLGDGVFRLQRATDIQDQASFSLFRNQAIDLKIEASVGQGTSDLPDFYLDTTQEKLIELEQQISPQIKFPVENENKISYGWNYEEFAADKVQYKHPTSPDKKPEDGNAQLDTKFKLIRKQGQNSQEITGDTIEEAVEKIKEQLEKDFQNQLKFQTTYFDSKGSKVEEDGNDIYKFKELKNKDRIVLKIVAVADDLFYVNEQPALVINVNGLTQAAPNQEKMQYLRVKQGGLIDGQGSFKVLVSNPDNPDEDEREILKGWKFMIRVWDKNKDADGKWQIKIPWSDDPARIRGLANGDKVEWKLVSSDGNPVKDAYYNTIALRHDQNDGGNIDYQFAQVNYPNGQTSYEVFQEGIGDYPANDDQYPENSGFVISGLQPEFKVFKIDQQIFEKIIQELNPFYVGFDHQGTINFDNKYLENDYWVNTNGEIYLKDQAPEKLTNEIEELPEISIKDFIDKITFFTQDPVLFPYQNGFKFSGNDVNISNHLANGDQVWAQFNMIDADDENSTINTNENLDAITIKLADVSGLKNASDPMSPLWYVLMALAGILTLGTASLVAYLIARNKKLNGKN